jgi:hypothetical protein
LTGSPPAKTIEERHKLKIIVSTITPNRFFFIVKVSFLFKKY